MLRTFKLVHYGPPGRGYTTTQHLILWLLLVSFHITLVFSQDGPAHLNGHGPFLQEGPSKIWAEKIDAYEKEKAVKRTFFSHRST